MLLNEVDPILVIIFLFSWAVSPFANLLLRIKSISFTKSGIRITISYTEKKTETQMTNKRLRILLLLIAISLSCVVVICPYLPSVNPKGKYVSVDSPIYERYLTMTKSLEGGELLRYLLANSERLLPILAMRGIQMATGSSSGLIVKAFPLLLGTLLVLSSYYLISVATHDEERALYSAFFASTSIVVTVGMFAGFYANWLSISMAMLSLAFIFGYVEGGKKSKLALSCIFLTLTCISHVWNWILFSASLLVYILYHVLKVFIRHQRFEKRRFLGLAMPLGTSLSLVFAPYMIYDFSRVILMRRYISLFSSLKVVNLFIIRSNLIYVLEALYTGFISNSFYFVAAIIGILTTSHEELSKFYCVLLLVTSIPFLFYGPNLQGRLLYVQPIHLMCAKGVCKIARVMRARGLRLSSRLFVIACILLSTNYALGSIIKLI